MLRIKLIYVKTLLRLQSLTHKKPQIMNLQHQPFISFSNVDYYFRYLPFSTFVMYTLAKKL